MDWSKAKSILIFIFFALNIFLLYQLIFSPSMTISRDNLENTLHVLSERGVVLRCDIPAYSSDEARLSYEGGGFSRPKIINKLLGDTNVSSETVKTGDMYKSGSKQVLFLNDNYFEFTDTQSAKYIDLSAIGGAEKYVRNFLSEVNISTSGYILDDLKMNNDGTYEVWLTEQYKRFLLFDNYVRATVSEEGISRLECRKAMSYSVNPKKIIPAYQVLLQNFISGQNEVITSIDIGFKEAGQDTHGLKAAWRVGTQESSTPLFFDAFTGEAMGR